MAAAAPAQPLLRGNTLEVPFNQQIAEWLEHIVGHPDTFQGGQPEAVNRAKLAWRVGWALGKHAARGEEARNEARVEAGDIVNGRRDAAVGAINDRYGHQMAANTSKTVGGTAMVAGGIMMIFPPTTIAGIITTVAGGVTVAGSDIGKAVTASYKTKVINDAIRELFADHRNDLVKGLYFLAQSTTDVPGDEVHPALATSLLRLVDLSMSFYRQYTDRLHAHVAQVDLDLQEFINGILDCTRRGYYNELSRILKDMQIGKALDTVAIGQRAWVRDLGSLGGVAAFGIISAGSMAAAQYGAAQALEFGQIFKETGVQMAGTFWSNNTQHLANASGGFAIAAGLLAIGASILAMVEETAERQRGVDAVGAVHTSITATLDMCHAPRRPVNLEMFVHRQ